MSSRPELKLAWCSHKAAKHAVEHWHYSRCMPKSKLVKIGVWEDGVFIGAVIYGSGATPNLGKPYNLRQTECSELVRVALKSHETPVSKILSVSLKLVRKANPGLKLIVSFADVQQGHHGGIYQANGWVYNGQTAPATFYCIKGKITHPRSIGLAGKVQNLKGAKELDANATAVRLPGKHRYLMPLNNEMRKQIEPLRKPYPKRVTSDTSDTPSIHEGKGGAAPTVAL